ncbi:uncharacterized protein LOC134753286 [Cydia strobilella]|uniref:uncharacterized protein LOC134753286 n=1 Tax=Cydia strobilella TaxID=1100964 RepID=UPI003005472B
MNVQVQEVHVLNPVRPDHTILQNALVQLQTPQEQQQMQQPMTATISVEVQSLSSGKSKVKTKTEKKEKKKEAIDGQAREIIFKVIKFFETEKQNRGYSFPVENVVKRACAATGLSESTIKRIKRDGLRAEATQTRIPGPKKKRVRKTKVQLDYFQLCALRGIVNSYSVRKEVPTLSKILAAAKHELNYRGGKESLRLILLNKLGIKFKKCEKKNKKPPELPQQAPQPQPQQQQQQQQQQQMPQVQHMMAPPLMPPMKPLETQCVYANMMQQVPPVSY